jgi:pimeloyl-ACP methyl ester carboxylesterase
MRALPTAREKLGVSAPYLTCEIDGVAIAYRQVGQGPDIVCLHAIGHGGSDFDAVAPALSQRYRLTMPDWPGHGHSGADARPPGVARFGEILAGFIKARGLANVILIGNSVGGGAAIHYAHRAPDNVRALVLANPAGLVAQTPRTRRALRIMEKFFAAGVARRWWFSPAFGLYYRMVLPRAPARDRRRAIVDARFEIAPLLTQAWRDFGQPSSDLRTEAASLKCPVLFTWAMRDRFVRYDLCRDAIRAVPNATVEKFDAGHTPFLETPEAFVAAVEKFLDQQA